MASSNSLALPANTPRTDSRKSYMSDIGHCQNETHLSHCKFDGNLYKRNEPHGSSWSLSNLSARNSIRNESKYPYYENIRRKSEDNIRKQYLVPSNSKISLNDGAICTQPRESNKSGGRNNSSKNTNSVVHWTNSVENRVCCPETVLYGAVYGLKCLK